MADRIDGTGTRQDSRPSSRASATSDHGIDHRRQVGTPRDEGKFEMFEGRMMEVKNPSRQGWWRYHTHYDRDGYCDNPARGY